MKVTRRRTYNLDPRFRKQRLYTFRARQFDGFTKTNAEGHSRAIITGHGYGSTPAKAKLNARKTVKRREKPRPKNARELADDRRYSEYVHQKFERLRSTARDMKYIRAWRTCEHDWQETHPRATSFAERCQKCNAKRGIKPDAPDSLRDYW